MSYSSNIGSPLISRRPALCLACARGLPYTWHPTGIEEIFANWVLSQEKSWIKQESRIKFFLKSSLTSSFQTELAFMGGWDFLLESKYMDTAWNLLLLISLGSGTYFHTQPALHLSHAFLLVYTITSIHVCRPHECCFFIIHRNVAQT